MRKNNHTIMFGIKKNNEDATITAQVNTVTNTPKGRPNNARLRITGEGGGSITLNDISLLPGEAGPEDTYEVTFRKIEKPEEEEK